MPENFDIRCGNDCNFTFTKCLPLNIGATRNTVMVPDDENCPKNVCIPNIGIAYKSIPKKYGIIP